MKVVISKFFLAIALGVLLGCVRPRNLNFSFMQSGNPDQVAGSSTGGDNGEFLRRNQPQEHLFIPLINSLEVEYNPYVAPDIREYRHKESKDERESKLRTKMDQYYEKQTQAILK